jgi:hypothetical protein
MKLRFVRHGVKAEVEVDQKQCVIRVLEGGAVPVETPEGTVEVGTDEELVIPKLL